MRVEMLPLLLLLWACLALAQASGHQGSITLSGYLTVNEGGQLFYTYHEAQDRDPADAPILIWLQGGPGCASQVGRLYELGPEIVDGTTLLLKPNPGAWNRQAALLFIDQPVGAGFSIPGKRGIPENEMEIAADLYVGLQRFFKLHPHLALRPVIFSGESYAGKYVPSIAHFILQQELLHQAQGKSAQRKLALRHTREVPSRLLEGRGELLEAPVFQLKGVAIGNGMTDPEVQVGTHADTAHSMGLLDERQMEEARALQAKVQELISLGKWSEAHEMRQHTVGYIAFHSGAATLLDIRRAEEYDADRRVDTYLNQAHIKEALGVPNDLEFVSCSPTVMRAMGADVMKSVRYLFPDLLDALPILIFNGQYDIQDGPVSTEAWLSKLEWSGKDALLNATRHVIRGGHIIPCARSQAVAGTTLGVREEPSLTLASAQSKAATARRLLVQDADRGVDAVAAARDAATQPNSLRCNAVAAYWKTAGALDHVVIRGAGHMVPADQPVVSQYVIERWLAKVLAA